MSKFVCVGQIVNVHGVKGTVKIKPNLLNPKLIASLGVLTNQTGSRSFRLKIVGQKADMILAQIEGISDRTTAEQLKGVSLYAPRDNFPAAHQEEFYYIDLVGLTVLRDKQVFGKIQNIENFGAGDIVEVKLTDNRVVPFSFTRHTFVNADLKAGTIEIVIPFGMEDELK